MSKLPVSEIPVIERIARLLAAREQHAAGDTQDHWRECIGHAQELLREIRVPDAVMARAGDPAMWERMIAASLHEAQAETASKISSGDEVRDAGPSQMSNPPRHWSKTDESIDESFPASDPPPVNPGTA